MVKFEIWFTVPRQVCRLTAESHPTTFTSFESELFGLAAGGPGRRNATQNRPHAASFLKREATFSSDLVELDCQNMLAIRLEFNCFTIVDGQPAYPESTQEGNARSDDFTSYLLQKQTNPSVQAHAESQSQSQRFPKSNPKASKPESPTFLQTCLKKHSLYIPLIIGSGYPLSLPTPRARPPPNEAGPALASQSRRSSANAGTRFPSPSQATRVTGKPEPKPRELACP